MSAAHHLRLRAGPPKLRPKKKLRPRTTASMRAVRLALGPPRASRRLWNFGPRSSPWPDPGHVSRARLKSFSDRWPPCSRQRAVSCPRTSKGAGAAQLALRRLRLERADFMSWHLSRMNAARLAYRLAQVNAGPAIETGASRASDRGAGVVGGARNALQLGKVRRLRCRSHNARLATRARLPGRGR